MKLKEWLEQTKKQMKGNDSYSVFCIWRKENMMITPIHIKRYPQLLEADIVKEDNYETEYMSFSLSMKQTGKGKCMQYNCWLDNKQVNLATNWNVD